MSERRPMVIRGAEAPAPSGPPTAGMERRQLLDEGERWFGWVRTEPGLAGGWHHHGDRDSYVYVVRGAITIEYGRGGVERIEATAGDLILNPARIVHREVTGPGEPAEAFVVRLGPGPLNVNVDGPDAGAMERPEH
ncbi:MAG TPA: cupin domain-containing protein [Candidatus Limnocylindrales bacterium]|nr:cupin domain-containing protein [Candidatus Limnocylindrales bacterium]